MFSTQSDHVPLFDLFVLESRTSLFTLIYIIPPPILIPNDDFLSNLRQRCHIPAFLTPTLEGSLSAAFAPKASVGCIHQMIGGDPFVSVKLGTFNMYMGKLNNSQ